MRRKRTSGALLTSIVFHVLLVLIAGLYFVTQTQIFTGFMSVDVFETPPPKPPNVRNTVLKRVSQPSITTVENEFVADSVQTTPRLINVALQTQHSVVSNVSISHRDVNVRIPINPNVPRVVDPTTSHLKVTTAADLPVASSPNSMLPVLGIGASVPSVGVGSTQIARGVAAGAVQVKVDFPKLPGLSMVEHVGVKRSALDNVVGSIPLGNDEIPSINDGEPRGIVIGRGKDIRGVLRFTRVRHTLSDWWADSSSLNALTKWLNERTKIRTDMNVEGGAVKLTDANLQKSPLVFMTGHDPALVRSRNLLGRQQGGGKMDSRFTEAEAAGLREYLVERGGFLVFDDCGVNAPAQAMTRLFLSQMRSVMPEYQVERIKNTHEIYRSFYEIGGPPVGFDIFWWGTRPPKRNYLEGFSVGEKLSVLVVRRDYMCAMEAVSLPTRSVHYSPGVYRFMTNVVVYALTTGGIADYTRYVPQGVFMKSEIPLRPPQTSKIRAIR